MFIIIIALVIALIATVLRKIYELVVPRETRDISGQVVLVTGGAKGLGREIVLAFAEKKCKIAVVDVDIENATETAKLVGSNAKAYKVIPGLILTKFSFFYYFFPTKFQRLMYQI